MSISRRNEQRGEAGVRAMLRDTARPAPIEAVDWDALHRRIMTGAVLPDTPRVAARQAMTFGPWWELAARWANAAVPLGVAAGLVAGLALARLGTGTDLQPSLVAAIRGEVPVEAVADRLVGPLTERWVTAATIGE
jgi:hypothetical protein